MGTTATTKITGIRGGAAVKATGTPEAALLGACRRPIEHVSKMLAMRGCGDNELLLLSLKRRLPLSLLLTLKLWEDAKGAREAATENAP
jgi:hypothetical protein